jgi:hypothetical protein
MNYLNLDKKEKFELQKLMLHHFTKVAFKEGFNDDDLRDVILSEIKIAELDENYEECALLSDVLKIWDDLNG